MTTLHLHADIHLALSHFALLGTAAVLEEIYPGQVRVHWKSPSTAFIAVTGQNITQDELASHLHKHALKHSAENSWVQTTHNHGIARGNRTVGLFSPRITVAGERADWQSLQQARCASLHALLAQKQWLSLAFIQALGEPAYWYANAQGKLEPDRGASGWEMKTRNRGEEFVQHRLAPLAREVSSREPTEVLAGVLGEYSNDEIGQNKTDSRAPTGFTPPRATDNALAWFALWGIALFPIVHRATPNLHKQRQHGAASITTGQLRDRKISGLSSLRRAWIGLPCFTRPTRLSTVKSVLLSGALARFTHSVVDAEARAPTSVRADARFLRTKGVTNLTILQQEATDNPNAPELWISRGRIIPVDSP